MLFEISRKFINISKYEETVLSWNNSVLTVRTNKNLHLLEFPYNLHSLDKGIDFKEVTVSSTKSSPLSKDYLTKYVSHGVKNSELVEMVINSSFWPHNELLLQEMTNITQFQWSPFHLLNENDNLLAVVNSLGNVEFFAARKYAWPCILNFSLEMKNHLGEYFVKLLKCPKNFTEVKNVVYSLVTAAICWEPSLNEDNSCHFVTAQKSGNILFWSIKYHHYRVQTQYCGSIQNSTNVEIVHMLWVPINENKFQLICSNEYGEIISNECLIKDKQISLLKFHNIWTHKDKMVTTYLCYHHEDDKLLLFFNKHRHLVIQLYNIDFNLLSQNVQNVNDYKITSITKHYNMFYLTTINTKIYKIDYSIVDDNLVVHLNAIEIKDPCSTYELNSIAVSRNGALYALALISRKLLYRKETLKIELVILSSDNGYETDIMNIINNPSKRLTDMWDLIEVIRCKLLKAKKVPEIDYSNLLKDESDVYKLKVYLIFLQFYYNLEKNMTQHLQGKMPETSLVAIKEKILMVQAFTVILNKYESYQRNSCLNGFDTESFEGSKNYLNYYCQKYNKRITDFVSEDILNISNLKFKYFCQCCDEDLIEFSCKNKHINMFCSLTLTPVENDYLICKSCNATARMELYNESPTCVFCDLHLINSNFIT